MSGLPLQARGGEVRLFFALWPDAVLRARITAAARDIALPAPGRPVDCAAYHLTVAFVGAVAAADTLRLEHIGAELRAAPCRIEFDAYEYWPKPEVIVAAARTVPHALERLWISLHERLADGGFDLHPKRLRPHVTLARKVMQAPVLPTLTPFVWPATAFSLVRSDTGGSDRAYTVLATWPLLDETPRR